MNSSMIVDGTIFFTHGTDRHVVDKSHVNYAKILTAIKGRKFGVASRLAANTGVTQAVQKLSDRITVNGGEIRFDDEVIHNVVTERILAFVREGLPYKPLARFLERLQANPSRRSINELYKFLEHKNMPITDDGCFIAYKAIRNNWTDKHTGTKDNHVGKTPEEPRNTVDDDFTHGCSNGLHAGSYEYAMSFASGDDRVVLVKIDPADVVSVPSDCSFQKLRACRYRVMEEIPRDSKPLTDETYQVEASSEPLAVINDDDDDDCWDCGEVGDDCEC